jgi:hypothetical protein
MRGSRLLLGVHPARGENEVELTHLEQLEDFRHRGVGSDKETGSWMHEFSKILLAPPVVELLRVDENY